MENKDLKDKLDNFLNDEKKESNKEDKDTVVVETRTGLIERVDRTLVTQDGRQLLREENYR